MKKLSYLFIAAILPFIGCKNEELEKQIAELNEEKYTLQEQLQSQRGNTDSLVNSYFESFNEIQANLDEIKEREKLVAVSPDNGEMKQDAKEKIVSDITLINDLLLKNKQTIANLRSQVKKSNLRLDEFEKMIERLSQQIQEKDAQIAELQTQLANMDQQMKVLFDEYNQRVEELGEKTDELNTAFYCFGTSKELIENGVLTKEGGFVGIGKNTILKDDFNKKYFTQIDITQFSSVPVGNKKIKIITTHPSSSYKANANDKGLVDKIEITNYKEFWSASKYLVVVVE